MSTAPELRKKFHTLIVQRPRLLIAEPGANMVGAALELAQLLPDVAAQVPCEDRTLRVKVPPPEETDELRGESLALLCNGPGLDGHALKLSRDKPLCSAEVAPGMPALGSLLHPRGPEDSRDTDHNPTENPY